MHLHAASKVLEGLSSSCAAAPEGCGCFSSLSSFPHPSVILQVRAGGLDSFSRNG